MVVVVSILIPKKSHTRSLSLYCLPSSVTEYLASSQEAAHVRSILLNQSTTVSDATVVAYYDPKPGTIVGGDKETVLTPWRRWRPYLGWISWY